MTPKNPKLTAANHVQISFLREFLAENDRIPNRKEFAKHFGWKSDNAADCLMKKFVQLGVLEKSGTYYYRFSRDCV